MPKIKYQDLRFGANALDVIEHANTICEDYARQGYGLTLRQLYYQFVSQDLIPNRQSEYKRLGETINRARLAGLVDWDHLEDRTRSLRGLAHFRDPSQVLSAARWSFRTEAWRNQLTRVEVWVEKDALVGVLSSACASLDVDYFSCRGYTSQSEMWGAARRLARYEKDGQATTVIHLGDHDPSGIDMTRDIQDRLRLFGADTKVRRVALSRAQVDETGAPPNPAKLSDSRAADYIARYGDSSWELDALPIEYLDRLIRDTILEYRDERQWAEDQAAMETERERLRLLSDIPWTELVQYLERRND
jgi:hypothetical protein